ncbi:WD-40 repeat protein [Cylindrospermum sp. NIES-4074]|nr:WD-40 repeat protein [Cylindrospermum sp. NIES-4074]
MIAAIIEKLFEGVLLGKAYGNLITVSKNDGVVNVWNRNGAAIATLAGHSATVFAIAFSPDGQIIASGSGDNTVKLWKLDDTELTTLRGHRATIRGVAYSHDGTFAATVSEDNTLMMWNVQRILNLDLLTYGCDRVRSYLQTNRSVEDGDRLLCDQISN